MAAVSARLKALRRKPTTQLRDHAVHCGEIGQRPRRQCPVQLAERSRRGQAPRALDLRALQLPAQQGLEAAQALARQAIVAGVVSGELGLRLGAQPQRAADALHIHADHA